MLLQLPCQSNFRYYRKIRRASGSCKIPYQSRSRLIPSSGGCGLSRINRLPCGLRSCGRLSVDDLAEHRKLEEHVPRDEVVVLFHEVCPMTGVFVPHQFQTFLHLHDCDVVLG